MENFFLNDGKLDIGRLKLLQEKPLPFTPGEPLFWNDPHISKQMLEVHLNPTTDAASRQPETIVRSVDWMVKELKLQPGASILDLGCGPGLYASRLAEKGFCLTGVDYSQRSIEYARQYARDHHLEITYRYMDYLALEDESLYDAVLLIYGDFCPLSPEQRTLLLRNVHRALKPGGSFVLDVTTPFHRKKHGTVNGWYALEKGFWKPGPHLVLEEGFDYQEQAIFLDQAIVIEENGQESVYRNWFQDYDRSSITHELEAGSFTVQSATNDLCGTPYSVDSEWIGIIARKK